MTPRARRWRRWEPRRRSGRRLECCGGGSSIWSASGAVHRECKPKPPKIPAVVCTADRERYQLLHLRDLLTAADQARGKPEREGPGHDPEGLDGGMVPRPHERPLHFAWQRATHRPKYDRSGARSGVAEFSAVWAYTPT